MWSSTCMPPSGDASASQPRWSLHQLLLERLRACHRDAVHQQPPALGLPPISASCGVHAALHYPKVAVQLPMFNERAVCQAIVDAACELQWPVQRLKIQARDQEATAQHILYCLFLLLLA